MEEKKRERTQIRFIKIVSSYENDVSPSNLLRVRSHLYHIEEQYLTEKQQQDKKMILEKIKKELKKIR